ncbi:subtilisin-like protease SBT2.2 [Tanacetum coccineum]
MKNPLRYANPRVNDERLDEKNDGDMAEPGGIDVRLVVEEGGRGGGAVEEEGWGPIMAQRAYANPDLNQSPATPFDMGSGFVNATAVLDPGLILDLGYEDYMSFLCGINGSAPVVLNYTSTDCGATMVNGADLNLPSITMVNEHSFKYHPLCS